MSEKIDLFINDTLIDLLTSSTLTTANYDSSITVDTGGYSRGVARGTGYNKTAQKFQIAFWISSYTGNLLDEYNKFVSLFIYTPNKRYRIKYTDKEGQEYFCEVTAPRVSKPAYENQFTIKATVSFDGLDNYFKQDIITREEIELQDTTPKDITVDSTMPIEFSFVADITIAQGGQNLFLRFGNPFGKYIEINTLIPATYDGVVRLNLSSITCFIEDLDLTSLTLGSLPILSTTAPTPIYLESNVLIKNTFIEYTKGVLL